MCKKYEEINRRMNKAEKEAEEEAKARKEEDKKLKKEIEKLKKELSDVKERLGEVEEKQVPEEGFKYEECKKIIDEIRKEERERKEEERAAEGSEDGEGSSRNARMKQEEGNRLTELKWKQKEMERERIRNNIVFIGLEEEIKGKSQVECWCEENLDIGISFEKIWEIKGRKGKIGARCQTRRKRNENKEEQSVYRTGLDLEGKKE